MADCEMPLVAASFLKSASQASKLPVPQEAASEGVSGKINAAINARAVKAMRGVIGFIRKPIVD
jgi:hypothetical protein